MPANNKQSGFGCLTFVLLIFGLMLLRDAIIAFKNGITVTWGGRGATVQISPWIALSIAAAMLKFAIIGIVKIWKDKDKFPPL